MSSSPSTSMSPSSCSTLQEGDSVRKSGPIVLLSCNKKKGQPLYAVLSERALELHESEKAQRKKKGTKSIVDLSKCFNVSQQNYPKSRTPCVCLLMPDECFVFRGESVGDTADWYSSLLFAVISARALRLGRPVFPNEFFECVWDVTIFPAQPKLKMPPHNPDNSPNICAKLPQLAGRKRLCFYPHTIIICKLGIEPANSGLPKSGIPPFRTMDFVEFSRHFIASYGSQEKYFIMRIGRGSPMGSCEVWVQCESEETAAEVKNKLADIIRRETEKKQCALLALGNIAKPGPSSKQSRDYHHHHHHHASSASEFAPSASVDAAINKADGSPELETISEDEQYPQQQHPEAEEEGRSPSASISSASGSGRRAKQHNHHHSSLSQSAREKRTELRECKAKVDSLEEEEQRFREQQHSAARQREAVAASGCPDAWRRYNAWGVSGSGTRAPPPTSGSSSSGSALLLSHSHSRPAYLGFAQLADAEKPFRRRGSATSMDDVESRSKSASLEQQQKPQHVARNCWNRKSPLEMNNNSINDFGLRWMDGNDSLNMLGAGQMGSFFYGPEEETEDSGGTLRIPLDEHNSLENSRSASSLNLNLAQVEVECHAVGSGGEDEPEPAGADHHSDHVEDEEGTSTEEEEGTNDGKVPTQRIDLATVRQRRKQQQQSQQKLRGNHSQQQQHEQPSANSRRRPMTTESSQEAAEEADQSCCSSSIASSSSVAGRDEVHQSNEPSVDHHQQHHKLSGDDSQQHNANNEYMLMDKLSSGGSSSDSFPHLAVPSQHQHHPWDHRVPPLVPGSCCPEEICSCASDSGDSCYSSMVNGQLNPRAFSFSSSATDGSCGGGGQNNRTNRVGRGGGAVVRAGEGRHWTMGVMSGVGALNRSSGVGGNNPHTHPPVHFSPRTHQQMCPASHANSPTRNNANANNSFPDSSSSSRFSMETSLITPLEEDERQVSFAGEEEERDKLDVELSQRGGNELRKRAFSLGSKSWITKPFRKLSSAHGTPSSSTSSTHPPHHRHARTSESARSGTSSLAGSVHADLSSAPEHGNSQTRLSLSQRLGSSSSFASSSIADHHNRSDSIGSSHSAAFSLPGAGLLSQKLLRKKRPSEEHVLPNEDLVELEFMPSSANNPLLLATKPSTSTTDALSLRSSPLRARTSSCAEPESVPSKNAHAMHHYQQSREGTPRGRASAGALDYNRNGNGNRNQHPKLQRGGGGSCCWTPRGEAQQHQQQLPLFPQHQQLRPSESFIRSIQLHQQELQKVRGQQKRHKSKSDFPLQEVQCFIAPAEREKIDALTARDSMSMRSQRSGSGSTFETIQEGSGPITETSNRRNSSRPSSSMASADSHPKLCQSQTAEEEDDDYVLSGADSVLKVKA